MILVRESVVVTREPYGSSTFPLCTAEFEPTGTVIVRAIETGMEMQRFAPGTWKEVKGVGAGGLELYRETPLTVPEAARRMPRSA